MPRRSAAFIRTGQRIEGLDERFEALFRVARAVCPDGFPAEETRTLDALYDHVPLGLVDRLGAELAAKLDLPRELFLRDRFSVHGCGPVGLHDDFFRYPRWYFAIIVAHSGGLGLVDAESRAQPHHPGDILLLDPRRKHALVPVGLTAAEHPYEQTHSPVHDARHQFLFLDFDLDRSALRSRFRLR